MKRCWTNEERSKSLGPENPSFFHLKKKQCEAIFFAPVLLCISRDGRKIILVRSSTPEEKMEFILRYHVTNRSLRPSWWTHFTRSRYAVFAFFMHGRGKKRNSHAVLYHVTLLTFYLLITITEILYFGCLQYILDVEIYIPFDWLHSLSLNTSCPPMYVDLRVHYCYRVFNGFQCDIHMSHLTYKYSVLKLQYFCAFIFDSGLLNST